MKETNVIVGGIGEAKAFFYLKNKGYRIIDTNLIL